VQYDTIIIPVDERQAANTFCGELVENGEGTFTVTLSPNGQLPATHYVCNWWIDENGEVHQALAEYFGDKLYVVEDVFTLLQSLGLQLIQEEVG